MLDVSAATFDHEVIGSEVPIVVDFWTEWCGPCKAVAPLLDVMAEDYADQVAFVKVNISDAPKLAKEYQIRSIPTLVVFSGGQEVGRVVGGNLDALRDILRNLLT